VDTTDCLGLPFPVCAPPLVKDASDIAQLRDLAIATDTAVQELADRITNQLTNPPAVSVPSADNTAGNQVDHFLSGTPNFDNAGMADTVSDVIRVNRAGWYMIGGTCLAQPPAPGIIGLRCETLVNGDPLSTQGNGFDGSVNGDKVTWRDIAFLSVGDVLTVRTRHTGNAADVIVYGLTLWALGVRFDD